ncbi:MAG: hypothetical protein EXR11_08750 [Rhodospirillaceae bacterium]|nr:hypothetical protein [Rhodospirillaceae bacterium]
MPYASIRIFLAWMTLAVGLSSCGGKPDPVWAQLFGYDCTTSQSSAAGAFCSTHPPGEGVAEVSRYCYQTLADANCLDRPDAERKNQALGSSGY